MFIGEIGSNSSETQCTHFLSASSLAATRSIHILPHSTVFRSCHLLRATPTEQHFPQIRLSALSALIRKRHPSPHQPHHHPHPPPHGNKLKSNLLTSPFVRCPRRLSCPSSTTQVQHGIHHQWRAQDQRPYQAGGEWAQEQFLCSEAQSFRPLYWGQPSRGRCSKQSEGLCRSTRWTHCHYVGRWKILADPVHGTQANGCLS